MNPNKMVTGIIMIMVVLSIAGALYSPLMDVINNITGGGWVGTALLVMVGTLYWILIGAGVVLYMLKVFLPSMAGNGRRYRR